MQNYSTITTGRAPSSRNARDSSSFHQNAPLIEETRASNELRPPGSNRLRALGPNVPNMPNQARFIPGIPAAVRLALLRPYHACSLRQGPYQDCRPSPRYNTFRTTYSFCRQSLSRCQYRWPPCYYQHSLPITTTVPTSSDTITRRGTSFSPSTRGKYGWAVEGPRQVGPSSNMCLGMLPSPGVQRRASHCLHARVLLVEEVHASQMQGLQWVEGGWRIRSVEPQEQGVVSCFSKLDLRSITNLRINFHFIYTKVHRIQAWFDHVVG